MLSPAPRLVLTCVGLAAIAATGRAPSAQAPARVDFARDVQPILRQRCVGCHGSGQQMVGLRLDRRRDAMRGSTFGTVIGPGNAEASRLYLRISGTTRGSQMPPTGALPAEHIAVIKTWIDEGAEWPDVLSGDTPPVPADPGAATLMARLRAGDARGFQRALAATAAAARRQGAEGITPLMYAALYGTAAEMQALLDAGVDPNVRNDAGASSADVGRGRPGQDPAPDRTRRRRERLFARRPHADHAGGGAGRLERRADAAARQGAPNIELRS